MKKKVKIISVVIEGKVTGVGFRYFIKDHAQKLGIKGWIRNNSPSEVEALFISDDKGIEKMLGICCEGPPLSDVKKIKKQEIENIDISYYPSFQITH